MRKRLIVLLWLGLYVLCLWLAVRAAAEAQQISPGASLRYVQALRSDQVMKARAYAGFLLHSGRRMRAAFKLPPVNGPSKKYAALDFMERHRQRMRQITCMAQLQVMGIPVNAPSVSHLLGIYGAVQTCWDKY